MAERFAWIEAAGIERPIVCTNGVRTLAGVRPGHRGADGNGEGTRLKLEIDDLHVEGFLGVGLWHYRIKRDEQRHQGHCHQDSGGSKPVRKVIHHGSGSFRLWWAYVNEQYCAHHRLTENAPRRITYEPTEIAMTAIIASAATPLIATPSLSATG